MKVDLADQRDARATAWPTTAGPGIDRDQIEDDIEVVEGSNFDDTLFGSDRNETFRGLNGNDLISGGGGNDFVDEGTGRERRRHDHRRRRHGDRVSYGTRTAAGVNVSLDGVRDDGATGENDDVRTSVENIIGGSNFGDTLTGNGSANTIEGFGGADTVDGLARQRHAVGRPRATTGVGGGSRQRRHPRPRRRRSTTSTAARETDTADRDTIETSVVGCERGHASAPAPDPRERCAPRPARPPA